MADTEAEAFSKRMVIAVTPTLALTIDEHARGRMLNVGQWARAALVAQLESEGCKLPSTRCASRMTHRLDEREREPA